MLTSDEVAALARVAAVLLPGDETAPSAASITELPVLIARAADAIGPEIEALRAAVALLPDDPTWDAVRAYAEAHPGDFDVVSAVAAGAYFMAPDALRAIGYPQGARKAPRIDQAADELSGGVLDDVMAREPMFRQVPA